MASSKTGCKSASHDQSVNQEGDNPSPPNRIGGKKPPRPNQCRNFTREAVAESMPLIVEAFVDRAIDGSVPHFNHLAKFGGFDLRPEPAPSRRRGKSFARRLLDNMKEHEAKMIAANEARIAAERAASK